MAYPCVACFDTDSPSFVQTTGLIDLDLINTGRSLHQRKVAGDLRREFLSLLDSMGGTSSAVSGGSRESGPARAVRYAEIARALGEQSTVPIDAAELAELVRTLEQEGVVRSAGERERRTVRKIET